MRKQAVVRRGRFINDRTELRRVMLYGTEDGVYCLLYDQWEDRGCRADLLLSDWAEAESCGAEIDGIAADDREILPDPLPGCQYDWIQPRRIHDDNADMPGTVSL
jgi:hypothetical protein